MIGLLDFPPTFPGRTTPTCEVWNGLTRPKWLATPLIGLFVLPPPTPHPPWMGCYSIAGLPPALSSPVPIYTPGWKETLRVKCLAQQHNTMSLVRAWTWTTWSGVECTSHEVTAASTLLSRELKQTTTTTATRTSPNKRLNEQNNSCARALYIFVHFFAVLYKTRSSNGKVLCRLRNVDDDGYFFVFPFGI